MATYLEARPARDGVPLVWIHLKVVPGASRDQIAGPYGDRLRVKVAAPPEGGQANRAVLALLAERLNRAVGDLVLARGQTTPLKTVEVRGLEVASVGRLLYG